jgi:hypothetical protein
MSVALWDFLSFLLSVGFFCCHRFIEMLESILSVSWVSTVMSRIPFWRLFLGENFFLDSCLEAPSDFKDCFFWEFFLDFLKQQLLKI